MSMVFVKEFAAEIELTLEEKLGEGLNSIVYRATRTTFGPQTVAVKILKDETAISLLRRECETLQRINSVNCVRFISSGRYRGEPVLVLEWIDGLTLTQLAKQTLTSEEQDEIVRQIYVGLDDLHVADLVHGDLHPNNVMIDRAGNVKLIDFACGDVRDGQRQAVPAFASPEIWAGDEASPSSDLFALRVIRDLMPTGYVNLPARSDVSSLGPLKIAERNLRAKHSIARRLNGEVIIETQVIETTAPVAPHVTPPTTHPTTKSLNLDDLIANARVRFARERTRRVPVIARIAAAIAVILVMDSITMSAESPANQTAATAKLRVFSQNWMRLTLNGREVGYAPVEIGRLAIGHHHVVWESAASRGELRFDLKPNETLRLNAKGDRLERN